MTNPSPNPGALIAALAQTLAESTHKSADRQLASQLIEDFPALTNTRNCEILLALAGLIAAQGADAADTNNVPRGIGISIVAGAVSILAQMIGQEMLTAPRSEDIN